MLPTARRVSGENTDAVNVEAPILVQTRRRRFAAAGLLCVWVWVGVFSWVLAVVPATPSGEFHLHFGGFMLGFCLLCTITFGLWSLNERAWKRRAAVMGYALCCRCGYSLRGLTEQRECPECGWHFHSLDEVKAAWRDWEPTRAPWWFRAVAALIRRFRRRT